MDLTTLQRTKDYLAGVGVAATGADALYAGLISRASDAAMEFTGRNFQRFTSSGLRLDGSGSTTLMLPSNPIISVSSLAIDGTVIPSSPDAMAAGYQFDLKFLYLFGGFCFRRGTRNVLIGFSAGFSTSQAGFVPGVSPYTITPVVGSGVGPDGGPLNTAGPAVVDRGVVRTVAGTALAAVGSNPAAGQYSFSGGVYTFNAADAALGVTISYDYVPGSVEQAVLELVGTKLKQRDNLGISSKTMGQETISYADKDFPASVKALLQPYRFLISP